MLSYSEEDFSFQQTSKSAYSSGTKFEVLWAIFKAPESIIYTNIQSKVRFLAQYRERDTRALLVDAKFQPPFLQTLKPPKIHLHLSENFHGLVNNPRFFGVSAKSRKYFTKVFLIDCQRTWPMSTSPLKNGKNRASYVYCLYSQIPLV